MKQCLSPSPLPFLPLLLLTMLAGACLNGAPPAHAEADLQASAQGVIESDEYRTNLVQSYYQRFLGRQAQPAEVSPLVEQLKAGGTAWLKALAAIIGSDDYFKKVGNTNDKFVTRVFQDLVGRVPDPMEELPSSLDFLNQGGSRPQLAEVILDNDAFKANVVKGNYQKLLRRVPTAEEATTALNLINTSGIDQFIMSLVSSPEYFTKRGGGTNDGWSAAVSQDLLGRGAGSTGGGSTGGATGGSTGAGSTGGGSIGGSTDGGSMGGSPAPAPSPTSMPSAPMNSARLPMVQALLTSPEYFTSLVQSYYQKFLRRAATPAEITNWLAVLQQGGNSDQVMLGILTSDEYYNRAGGTTNGFVTRLAQDLLGQASGATGGKTGKSPLDLLDILRKLPGKQ